MISWSPQFRRARQGSSLTGVGVARCSLVSSIVHKMNSDSAARVIGLLPNGRSMLIHAMGRLILPKHLALSNGYQ